MSGTDPSAAGVIPYALPFRLASARLQARQAAFNARAEVRWFGFEGRFEPHGAAVVRLVRSDAGHLGGGGTAALNGGLIAAGFDGACVLAALGHHDSEVVVTLTLQVHFLRLANVGPRLRFVGAATRTTSALCFAQALLLDDDAAMPLASASATLAARGPALAGRGASGAHALS